MDNHESLIMESRDVKEASVEGVQRRTNPKKHFVFCVKVTWSDGTVNLVYRRYREFLHLQTMLHQAFPKQLGKPGSRKAISPLPSSFSSRMNVGEAIFKRMEMVSYFLKDILTLESKIARSKHITSFLTTTPEDMEPEKMSPKKRSRLKKGSRGNFKSTVRGRLHKFGKTRVYGTNISSPIIFEHFVVLDNYKKQSKTDISLKKGTIVDVIEKRECGWWLVDADGEVGWAPALFLEPADETVEVTSDIQVFDIGKGEFYVTSKRYVAVEDDELTFDIGVNLQIIEKNFDGWWKASYLGREGWVPAMHLRKLGGPRRPSSLRMGRRKSRMVGTATQLRSNHVDDDDEIIGETPSITTVNNLNKEEKSKSTPKAKGKKTKARVTIKDPHDQDSDNDVGEKKSINTMVEMSSMFLQVQKREETLSNGSPKVKSSPRPGLQRRAISAQITSFDKETTAGDSQGSKDDSALQMERAQSLDSMLTKVSQVQSEDDKNVPHTSLPDVRERQNDEEDNSNENPLSSERSNVVEKNGSDLKNENEIDSDSGSCDISHTTFSHIEVVEAFDGFCKQPVDESTHFRKTSSNEGSPKVAPPRRSPPTPRDRTNSANMKSPNKRSTLPNGNPRNVRDNMKGDELQRNNTFPPSGVARKVIRQDSLEEETDKDLNQQMRVLNSSDDDSEPEWAKSSLDKHTHPKLQSLPSIVIDKTEKRPSGDGNELTVPLDDGVASTESFEIEINISNDMQSSGKEYCPVIYYVEKAHEVDSDMFLNKGSFVKVLEKAENGWWFVQGEDGTRGWTRSSFLGLQRTAVEDEAGGDSRSDDEEDNKERPNEEQSCRVLEDYEADPNNQEIDLQMDEIVRILYKADSGWWCVRNTQGEIGWAPSNFLEEIEKED